MKFISVFVYSFLLTVAVANQSQALVGLENLESRLIVNNSQLLALQSAVSEKESLARAAHSEFYPTLNAVGGWQQNTTDELNKTEKGYVGYLEGKVNLFKGFKDSSVLDQNNIDIKISRLNYELKHRQMHSQLVEVISDMAFLHQFEKILDEESQLTAEHKKMAAKKVAAGLTGSVDNLEFELRETEIAIEKRQIQQRHNEAHQKLLAIFGEEIKDEELDKIYFSNIETFSKSLNANFVAENNLEIQNSIMTYQKIQFEKNELKADFLPSLDFSYSYGRLTATEDSHLKMNESKYAVLLTIPLFSGFNSYYKTQSLTGRLSTADHDKNQKIHEIHSFHSILKTKLQELLDLYQINEKKVVTINQYFEHTLAEYKRGIKNSPDLVSATERLFSVKKKKYEILRELEILNAQLAVM